MIDWLERRRLLASDLSISGTGGADSIFIKQTNTSATVAELDVRNDGEASISVSIDGSADGVVGAHKRRKFGAIGDISLIDLGGGNDTCSIAGSVKISAAVSG